MTFALYNVHFSLDKFFSFHHDAHLPALLRVLCHSSLKVNTLSVAFHVAQYEHVH